jgi:hypothetical protein
MTTTGDGMPLIRTTLNPREEVEMDEQEAAVHEQQGLVWHGSDADLKELLVADPTNRLNPRDAVSATAQKASASSPADAKGAQS